MHLPFVTGTFLCDKLATDVIEHLLFTLQNDLEMNAIINRTSEQELSFDVRPALFLEGNSFLPNVHIVMSDLGNGSSGIVTYSLQKGPKALLVGYVALLLTFECILLYFARQLVTPVLLLLPITLIAFAAIMGMCGLYIFSKRTHCSILGMINATSERPLRIAFQKRHAIRIDLPKGQG